MLIASVVLNLFCLVLLYHSHRLRVQYRERLKETIEVNRQYHEQYTVLLKTYTRQTLVLSEISEMVQPEQRSEK